MFFIKNSKAKVEKSIKVKKAAGQIQKSKRHSVEGNRA